MARLTNKKIAKKAAKAIKRVAAKKAGKAR